MDRANLIRAFMVFACLSFSHGLSAAAQSAGIPSDLHPFKAATKSGIRFGYINHLGSVIIPAQYEDASSFREGRAAVKISGRWGSIDAAGKLVVPARYDSPFGFFEGLAFIRVSRDKRNSIEFIDRDGKKVMPALHGSYPAYFSNGLASVQAVGKIGYVDRTGNLVIPVKQGWEDWTGFSDHLAPVKINGKWGFINNRARLVIPARFEPAITYHMQIGCIDTGGQIDPIRFTEKLAAVGFGGKAGFIDWSGAFVIEPSFDAALPFSDGRARVRVNGKWGYIDRVGKTRIAPQFELAGEFSEGLAPVMVNGLWGFIDKDGAFALPLQFKGAGPFEAGLAVVESSGTKLIYIDKQGRKVWDYPGPN